MAKPEDIQLFVERDGENIILTAKALIGHRIVVDPPGLPAGKYYERLGAGVPEGHHYLFGPLEKCAITRTEQGAIMALVPASVHWWDIVEKS